MNGADDETRSGSTGLGDSAERSTLQPEATPGVVLKLLRRRWKMLGTILVTALTTVALYWVDEALSTDVWIFALLTVALVVYTALTIRSDLRIE